MEIRPERVEDVDAIRVLTTAAFRGKEYSSQTEAAIVDALREAGALTLSLVAVDENEIVGHVAFSPVTINGEGSGWYGLGPVSVRPDRQRQGTGQALITDGLARLEHLNAAGCVLLGDPAYYHRFGFRTDPALQLPGVPPQYFQTLAFTPVSPQGTVAYHPGFDAT